VSSSLDDSPKLIERMEAAFAAAYQAQLRWSQLTVRARSKAIGQFASRIVEERHELHRLLELPMRSDYRETVTSELLPLADAARWLSRHASRVLATRYLDGGGSPWWLGRLRSVVHRVPYGLVLILGTWNYPIFLTGVQLIHALVAGNAVAIKPAPHCEAVTRHMVDLLVECGVPESLIVLLDSSIDAGKTAMQLGVDHAVITGSSQSGRAILNQAIPSITPATLELSGNDALYVLPGADLHRVCDLLRFGMRLNGGATCMAPRRVFIPHNASEVFYRLLAERLSDPAQRAWRAPIAAATYQRLWDGVRDALNRGARIFSGEPEQPIPSSGPRSEWVSTGHLVLTDVQTEMKLYREEIFAPLVMILPVQNWSDALQADSQCPYALTASIFGPLEDALRLVPFISAGTVTINDLIVPTADPRLPFGGRGESGFGVTRGSEGLLAMTTPKVVSTRLGSWLPHTALPTAGDEQLLDGVLQWSHGKGWSRRLGGLRQIVQAILLQRKNRKSND
jgi:acyl-CoA reductase-like NAD-dependent aldehyde dehydrogenase